MEPVTSLFNVAASGCTRRSYLTTFPDILEGIFDAFVSGAFLFYGEVSLFALL